MSGPRMLVVAGGTRLTASTRHRLWNFRPFLEADGIRLDWVAYGGGREASPLRAALLRARFLGALLWSSPRQDVVLVQKVLPPPVLMRRWHRAGARLVYDFDDALFARAVTGESEATWRRRKARFDAVLGAADVVVAGSPPLADYARGVARRVEVVYPSLDRARFDAVAAPPREPGQVVVGWIGNDQSQLYLRALEPVLTDVFGRHPRARLRVCSSVPPELPPALAARLDFVPWSEESELTAAASFDLAISPLGDEPWSRARGGRVSVLLSMASGVPVVASPGGGIVELAGEDGGVLFADDPETWTRRLDEMLSNAEARERNGARAREVIDGKIWAEVQYPRLRSILFGQDDDSVR